MRTALLVVAAVLPLAAESEHEKLFALATGILRGIERGSPALLDPQINNYVTGLARTLAANCAAGQTFNVRIFVNNDRNAAALPARLLIVHTELLRSIRSEAALAGALAQVFFQSLVLRPTVSDRTTISVFWMPTPEGSPYLLRPSPILPVRLLPEIQASINAADREAARCLADSGYDPKEFLTDLEMQRIAGEFHPQRIRLLQEQLATIPAPRDPVISTSAFTAIQTRLSTLIGGRAVPSLRVARAR